MTPEMTPPSEPVVTLGLPEEIQAVFEALSTCYQALMQLSSPTAFLEKSEGYWHQREQAIGKLSTFIEAQQPLSESLHGVLKIALDSLAADDARLQAHIGQLKQQLQVQRLTNTQQRQAVRHYGV